MNNTRLIQNFIIIADSNKKNLNEDKVTTRFRRNYLNYIIYIFSGLLLFFSSCNMMGKKATNETPTRGNIKISVDESFEPLIETSIYTFMQLYTGAKITGQYKPEVDVINDFMNDSVDVIVTSKKLTDYQVQYLRDTQVIARTSTYAYDALVLVTNSENKDTLLKYDTIKDIFTGDITNWNQINKNNKFGEIRVIFDNNKSGNIRYFKEHFDVDSLSDNFFAVNSNPDVIDFVSRNKDALGIISANWISDKDDSTARSYISKINVVAVSHQFNDDGYFYPPQQGFIYDKSYPFVREVYLISRESFTGLGSGFIQWACGDLGQRVVQKSGLLPATMPIRLVQMKE